MGKNWEKFERKRVPKLLYILVDIWLTKIRKEGIHANI
jgi:hypothetical protein